VLRGIQFFAASAESEYGRAAKELNYSSESHRAADIKGPVEECNPNRQDLSIAAQGAS
jgi:hypothetical protein